MSSARGLSTALMFLAPVAVAAGAAVYGVLVKQGKAPQPREVMNELFKRINDHASPTHADSVSDSDSAALQAMKAEHRTRVERLLDEDLMEASEEFYIANSRDRAYHFYEDLYQSIHVTTPIFPLSSKLFHRSLIYCDFIDLTMLMGVSSQWSIFARTLRKDLAFLTGCARRGFNDGLTGTLRGHIWMILSGADLLMSSQQSQSNEHKSLYHELLDRLQTSELDSPELTVARESIAKDVPRTIIHLSVFTNQREAESALTNVLSVYAISDPEVGYCQGLNMVAGYLLTKMPEEHAYWTLHSLLFSFKYDLRKFYFGDLRGLLLFKYQFQILFQSFLPALHQHFTDNGVYTDVFTEWIMTIFTFRGFPRTSVDAVWDSFLLHGQATLHQISLAILKLSEPTLLELDFEGCVYYLKNFPDGGILEPELLLETAQGFKVTRRMLRGLEIKYYDDQEQELKAQEVEAKALEEREQPQQQRHHQSHPHLR